MFANVCRENNTVCYTVSSPPQVHSGGKRLRHQFRALYDFYGKRVDYGEGDFPSCWPTDIMQASSSRQAWFGIVRALWSLAVLVMTGVGETRKTIAFLEMSCPSRDRLY